MDVIQKSIKQQNKLIEGFSRRIEKERLFKLKYTLN